MTTWTLDHNTYKYYSTIGELTVWGDPEDGDEVVINDNFSYIFKPSSISETNIKWKTLNIKGKIINYIQNPTGLNEIYTNRLIEEETELEVYMREANQFR